MNISKRLNVTLRNGWYKPIDWIGGWSPIGRIAMMCMFHGVKEDQHDGLILAYRDPIDQMRKATTSLTV